MTKADLVEQVYEAIGPGITKKDCGAVVDAFLNAVKQALAEGEHIEIRGFGTFKVRRRRARMARNPRTGDPVRVPARAVPIFKPSRLFKEDVARSERAAADPPATPEPPPERPGWP
jgi:nucleoid DNA-binding protein